jgi:tetratricopeptide (TPR) repeat protein
MALVAASALPDAAAQSVDPLLGEARSLMGATASTSLPPAHYARIEALLQKALEIDPRSTDVRVALASLYAKTGRAEQAVVLLHEILASDPRSAEAQATLGYVLRYAGYFDESIAAYRRAQELDDGLARRIGSEDQIAKSLIYRGDYDAALAAHGRMSSWLDSEGRRPDEKMLFYQGVAHLYAGHRDLAIACFTEADALEPASLWSRFARAYRAMARDDDVELRQLADAIAAEDPVDGERHYRLVHLYARLGDTKAAVTHLSASLARGFFAHDYLARDPLTATLRAVPEWQTLVSQARARHDRFPGAAGRSGVREELTRARQRVARDRPRR